MNRVSPVVLFFLCLIVMVPGCLSLITGEPATAEEALARVPVDLRGDWTLTRMTINGETTVVTWPASIGISFIHPQMLGGTAGCNDYYSSYALADATPSGGPQVTIGDPTISKNNCSTSSVEQQYLALIHKAWIFAGDNRSLTLTAANGDVLVYRRFTNRDEEDVPTTQPTKAEPVEMAYLEDTYCRMDETTETSYHCNGKVRIKSGVYSEVQVIAKFADNNTFESGVFAMGGSNPTLKSFIIFPDLKYKGRQPEYFVRLDTTRYPVNKDGNFGTAYLNPPPTPVYLPWHQVVTATHTPLSTTTKPTPAVYKVTGSGLSVTGINPANGSVGLQQYTLTGSNFRQYPPPEVYLRKAGSACEYCGVHATGVEYVSPTEIRCYADMRAQEGGVGTYDVLVTNSYLADSYAMFSNALIIR